MNPIHLHVLSKLKTDLVNDLDVNNDIIGPLKSEYILKDEDVLHIQSAGGREEQVKALLDILPDRGPQAFNVFHAALKHHYPWCFNDIEMEVCKLANIPPPTTNYAYQNIQPVPPLTVERVDKMNKLEDALKNLESNGYVILHGMKGYGKSSLVASILHEKRKDNLSPMFENRIYWIRFSKDRSIEDEIIIQMDQLSKQIKAPLHDRILFSGPLTTSYYDSDEEFVRYHFENNKQALLILDNVFTDKIIKQFDFKCKTLVITDDLEVVSDKPRGKRLEMNDGFTEAESLGLFSKALDVNVNRLPQQAKQIHELCRGMPLLIALLAAQFENFKAEMKQSVGRWKYYLDNLKTEDTQHTVIKQFFDLQEATYTKCIEQLDEKRKEYYFQFAIFSEDVNITSKTLEILWNESPYVVDELMMYFCGKSLAARKWNEDLKLYIYGIHGLLLRHLRKTLHPEKLKDLHKSLIEKYRAYCNNDFARLPDDNYSFSYIGLHLRKAGMLDEFPKLYLNLEFLQEKIKYSGLSDLFIDLKKYRKYITNNDDEELSARLREIEEFLRNSANIIAKHRFVKCLDLVQIALNFENLPYVYGSAQHLATKKSNKLYIVYESEMSDDNREFCEELEESTCTAAFTDDPNLVLVGCLNGKIILWDRKNRKAKEFHGHSKHHNIKKILLSDSGSHFLALNDNGLVKLFELDERSEFNQNGELRSPKEKQTFWSSFYLPDARMDESVKTFEIDGEIITDVAFSPNDEVAACTNKGTLVVWEMNGNLIWKQKVSNRIFRNIIFTSKETKSCLLHAICSSNGSLYVYKKMGDNFEYLTQYNLKTPEVVLYVAMAVFSREKGLVFVTERKVLFLKWFEDSKNCYNFDMRVFDEEPDPHIRFVAGHVTYDSQYLIIAKSNGLIYAFKMVNDRCLVTSFKGHVNSLDSYDNTDEGYHLICAGEKKWIHGWRINVPEGLNETSKIYKKVIFDAKVNNLRTKDMVILTKAPNLIAITEGQRLIDTIKAQTEIKLVSFCEDINTVLYVTTVGVLTGFNIDRKTSNCYGEMKSENFLAKFKVNDVYAMIGRKNDNDLKIIYIDDEMVEYVIPNIGKILHVHQVRKNYFITISEVGQIKLWLVRSRCDWDEKYSYPVFKGTVIRQASVSYLQSYLALITSGCLVKLYKIIIEDGSLNSEAYKIERFEDYMFGTPPTCTAFSNDDHEKFLAIALSDGKILIFDLHQQKQLTELELHCGPVRQLIWAPNSIDAPILLTVNCNELAWWNIGFLIDEKNAFRRSRMGSSRRASTPRSGPSPRASIELNSNSSSGPVVRQDQQNRVSEEYNACSFWKLKQAKIASEKAALLTVVQLPVSSTDDGNIFVSDDFSKFLTVDINGKVSKCLLYEYLNY